MLPFVSLIIPTLNEEQYLEQTIFSLISNDYPSNKFEILIVDGLSKDNTLNIAQRLAKQFSNIRIISNPKIYQSAALNIGVKESKGDFIIRADAHAIYDKNYISCSIDLLQKSEFENVGPVQISIGYKLIEKALSVDGTITGEHGIGMQKKDYLIKQHSDNIQVMQSIKKTLDPKNIMNPGKVFDL